MTLQLRNCALWRWGCEVALMQELCKCVGKRAAFPALWGKTLQRKMAGSLLGLLIQATEELELSSERVWSTVRIFVICNLQKCCRPFLEPDLLSHDNRVAWNFRASCWNALLEAADCAPQHKTGYSVPLLLSGEQLLLSICSSSSLCQL